MDEDIYTRNRIYIDSRNQKRIKSYKIFLAGAGIGSAIAESLLRLGFEDITIVDYDRVSPSNLNRQNYTSGQIGQFKTLSMRSRLLEINPKATINVFTGELTSLNMKQLTEGASVAINALDFTSKVPFVFDEYCKNIGISVIHPYNLGWGGLVSVFSPVGEKLSDLSNNYIGSEVKMVEHALKSLNDKINHKHWLKSILEKYLKEGGEISPPQLSVGCNILAAQCTNIIYNLAIGEPVKVFPKFYFYSILDDNY